MSPKGYVAYASLITSPGGFFSDGLQAAMLNEGEKKKHEKKDRKRVRLRTMLGKILGVFPGMLLLNHFL